MVMAIKQVEQVTQTLVYPLGIRITGLPKINGNLISKRFDDYLEKNYSELTDHQRIAIATSFLDQSVQQNFLRRNNINISWQTCVKLIAILNLPKNLIL